MKKYILLQGQQDLNLFEKIKNKYNTYKKQIINKFKGVRKP